MSQLGWLLCAVCAVAYGEVPARFDARMGADALSVGGTYEIVVAYGFGAGYTDGQGGVKSIVQIDVPDSVELTGDVLTGHKQLSKNEFLHAPFERALDASPAQVGFRLTGEPAPADAVHLNLIAYVTDAAGEAHFVRRRVALPVRGRAKSREVAASDSSWMHDRFLQIGERAPLFELPRADGSKVVLADLLEDQHVIVTTYRAFW